MSWILILFVSYWSDTVALTSVPGFRTYAECKKAGDDASTTFSKQGVRSPYVCVSQSQLRPFEHEWGTK